MTMSFAEQIIQKTTEALQPRPATEKELESLRSLGVPKDALSFYKEFTPEYEAEIGKVRLKGARYVPLENSDGIVPGAYCFPCGYVAFATNIYGDAYCFDTKSSEFPASAPIVLIAHDLEPEGERMSREELSRLAKPIAASFNFFLTAFISETLDLVPLYPRHDL
jgi:hypothetical protein